MCVVSDDPLRGHSNYDLVALLPLINLRKMTWSFNSTGGDPGVFWYAARQLSSVSSPCTVTEVKIIALINESQRELVKNDCRIIDEALKSDKLFPSLYRLELEHGLPYDYFPNLKERGLLG